MCLGATLWGKDSQHSSLVKERYRPSLIGSRLSLGGNHFLWRIAMPWNDYCCYRQWNLAQKAWMSFFSLLSVFFFGLLFDQLDWSTCFSKLSQRCNIHFAGVKSTVHTLLDSVVYKWFCVDLKVVGIFYLGAFLITNGSCVMMPIMSVVQQGGCNPSCRLMLENLYNWVLSVVVCCLPHHLSVFVCRALVLLSFQVGCLSALVWLVLSSPLSSPRLTPFFLAFCQRSQGFRWNDAVTKRARQRLPDMPSQVFVFWGPPLLTSSSSYSTTPPPPPDPWEQEVYLVKWWMGPLLLLGGKKKKPFFPSRAVRWV